MTLDSDTQLPPRYRPQVDRDPGAPLKPGASRSRGPRPVRLHDHPAARQPLPAEHERLAFSRLFSDPVGIDPYTNAVSDVYQDLAGEGSYQGKGIYDVRAFSRVPFRPVPRSVALSHDLIEGAHVRVGLASDIELYDEFPAGLFELRQAAAPLDSGRLANRRLDLAARAPTRRRTSRPTRSAGLTAGKSSTTCAAACYPQPAWLC